MQNAGVGFKFEKDETLVDTIMRDVSRTMEHNETNNGQDNGQLKLHDSDEVGEEEEEEEEDQRTTTLGNNSDNLLSSFRLKSEAQDEQQHEPQELCEQSSKEAQQLEQCVKQEQHNVLCSVVSVAKQ
ncbi:uncharacterized protein Dmoj_GI14483 [Drosophila mojavensis]|uniref:Uncharacterized protein n=1 Tax=Drosophila mojavensis TaxID=7230 RepID=B4KIP2_DROMO|nr:uncharacterized protein Dmoj_GI14483 [Drosophila mojavensis]